MKHFFIFLSILNPFVLLFAQFDESVLKQKFIKMTVEYRDFQGANKKAYRQQAVIKNEKGMINSHFYYNPVGQLEFGSESFIYDNNGNIKERKLIWFDNEKSKELTHRFYYENSFSKGKLKMTVITDGDNNKVNDSIEYYRNDSGELIKSYQHFNGNRCYTQLLSNGNENLSTVYSKGQLSSISNYSYNENGLNSKISKNNNGKTIDSVYCEYNDRGKLKYKYQKDSNKNNEIKIMYNYNMAGQLTIEERNENGKKFIIVYEYNDKGMIDKISIKNEKSIRLNEWAFTYE